MAAGKILEETLALYRRHFLALAGAMTLPAIAAGLGRFVMRRSVPLDALRLGPEADPLEVLEQASHAIPALAAFLLIGWFAQIFAFGAIADLLPCTAGEGRSVGRAYLGLGGRAGAMLALALLLLALVVGVPLAAAAVVLGAGLAAAAFVSTVAPVLGIAVGFFAAILGAISALAAGVILLPRFALGVPVLVREGEGAVASLRRSSRITRGRRLEVLIVCFLTGLAGSLAALIIEAPVSIAAWVAGRDGGAFLTLDVLAAVSAGLAVLVAGSLLPVGIAVLHGDMRGGGARG